MSNMVTIEPTEFRNVRDGETTLGFRIYDNYASAYCNTVDSIPDDDIELLGLVVECFGEDHSVQSMFDYVVESEGTMCIGGEYYGWDQIKEILELP